MNCVHEIEEKDQCSGVILKKCAVCKSRCLYSNMFWCKACQEYVHKRCLPSAKTIGVEETSPTTAAVEVEENGVTKSNGKSEESADNPTVTVSCDPEASAESLPATVRKNKNKKRAKKSASKNNLPPPTVLPVVPVADVIVPAPAATKASEIPPLDDNVPAADEAPSLPAPVRKTTMEDGKKNASTSDVQPSLVANVVSDAIPSKVGDLAGPNVRVDPKPAAVVPSCDDALPPQTLSTTAPKTTVKKKAAAVDVGTKNVPVVASPSSAAVVPVPDVIAPASGVVAISSKPAAGIPCLDAVPPPPVANALPAVSVADETAPAPARTADVAVVVPSLTVAEKKAAKRRAKVARKKAAARLLKSPTPAADFGEVLELPVVSVADDTASAPAASSVPANSSEVTGPEGTKAPEIPSLDDNVPAACEALSLPAPDQKTTIEGGKKNASTSDVQPPLVANVVSDAIPSTVTGPAATIVRVDPEPAAGIPCLDAVPPPPVANALPAVSVADETAPAPARTADVAVVVPSLTDAEKKAAKRRAKVARKKAAVRLLKSRTLSADFGGVVPELPVVSVADETASAPAASGVPANSSEVTGPAGTKASEIPSLDDNVPAACEAPSLPAPVRKTTIEGGKKNASTSDVQPPLVANVVSDAIPSTVTGPAATIVRIDPKPAAEMPSCDDAPPTSPTLSTAGANKAVKKNAAAVVVASPSSAAVVSVPDEIAPASGIAAIPSEVTGPAATIVRIDANPAAGIIPPRDDAPPPALSTGPVQTADVPSLTVAEKRAVKRRAKVAKKKAAAAESRVPPAAAAESRVPSAAADFGEVSKRLMSSTNPWITELKNTPLTGFKIASNHVTFVDNIASEEGMANILYNPVTQGLADKPMLVRLDVCPDRIFLGSGNTMDEAQEMAAFSFLADMHLRMNE